VQSVPADFTSAISIGGAAVRVPATGNNALGQNAVLTFNATAGQPLRILTSNDTFTPNISCLLTVRDAAGNAVTSAWVGAGMSTTIGPFTPGTTGVWSILLDPQGSYTGTITLNLVTP